MFPSCISWPASVHCVCAPSGGGRRRSGLMLRLLEPAGAWSPAGCAEQTGREGRGQQRRGGRSTTLGVAVVGPELAPRRAAWAMRRSRPQLGLGPWSPGSAGGPHPLPPCVPAPRALQATRDGPGSAPLPSRTPGSQGALGHEGRSWATGMSTMTRWVRGAPRGLLLCTPRWPWRCLRAEGGLPPGGLGRRGGGPPL